MALAPQEIGARIEQRRKELGWTHERLAHEMKVGLRTVQRWQKAVGPNGERWLPRLGTLMELADVMEVERSYFVEKPEPSAEATAQSELLQAVADGVAMLEQSQEQVLERLQAVLDRLERLEGSASRLEGRAPSGY